MTLTTHGAADGQPLAIVGATALPLHGAAPVTDAAVLVVDRRIVAVGPRAAVELPTSALIIDAAGCFVMPGLVDMHVHIGFPALLAPDGSELRSRLVEDATADLDLYLANGVTRVRNMWGAPFHLALDRDVVAGRRDGPRIHSVSAILDGTPPVWPQSPQIVGHAAARAIVEGIAADGFEAIKVYNHLDRETYNALVIEGRRFGLPVVGHVPFSVGIRGALAAGQRSIEHFRGYDFDPDHPPGTSGAADRFAHWLALDDDDCAHFAELTFAAGTWNCPTLVVVEASHATALQGVGGLPEETRYLSATLRSSMEASVLRPIFTREVCETLAAGRPRQLALLKAMHVRGCGLFVGTDAGVPGVLPGFSLHDELAAFVEAGLTPEQALMACCRAPAAFYGDDAIGRLAPGGHADLVVLDADPRLDIANTRRIAGVLAQGRWFDRSDLERRMERAARAQLQSRAA